MSIQLTITFGALIALCVLLAVLLAPLPTALQARIVDAVGTLLENKNVKVILAMFTIITSLSFVDCLRVGLLSGKEDIIEFKTTGDIWDQRAKKFYSQRNMYIFGFILFLEFALVFISWLVKSSLRNKTKLANAVSGESTETTRLQDLLKKKKADIETLKLQFEQNAKAYDEAHGSKLDEAKNKSE